MLIGESKESMFCLIQILISIQSIVSMSKVLNQRQKTGENDRWGLNKPGDFLRIWWILHCGARLILVVQRCRPLRLLSMLRLQQLKWEEWSSTDEEDSAEIYRWQHQEYHVASAAFRWQKRFMLEEKEEEKRQNPLVTFDLETYISLLDWTSIHGMMIVWYRLEYIDTWIISYGNGRMVLTYTPLRQQQHNTIQSNDYALGLCVYDEPFICSRKNERKANEKRERERKKARRTRKRQRRRWMRKKSRETTRRAASHFFFFPVQWRSSLFSSLLGFEP